MDLLYFGYEWDKDSQRFELEFISEVKEKFPEVVLRDAYDSIKGYRQKLDLPKEKEDDYFSWLIAHGWSGMSLTMELKWRIEEQAQDCKRWFEMAEELYPDKFKS